MSHFTPNLPTVDKSTSARNRTFTLIEMLVVVVIIGILAGVLVPRLVGARERASDSARIVKVGQISSAVELYAQEQGSKYPLAPLTTTGTSIARQDITDAISPYLTTIPTDPGKGTVAISTAPGNIQVTGDSFAYWTNTGGTVYAITALMESKKGNTTNATQIIDSDKQGSYQKVGRGLITNIVVAGGGGAEPAEAGVYYIGDTIVVKSGAIRYVIADKNAGATISGTDGTNVAIRGSYFQWGNKYGFSTVGTVSPAALGAVDTSAYNGSNPYNNSTFRYDNLNWFSSTRSDWSTNQNDDLRGNTTNTDIARRGPCSEGYHIPTKTERQGLYNVRKSIYTTGTHNGHLFKVTLKLPMAGRRSSDGTSIVFEQGSLAFYWSSTPSGQQACNMYFGASYVDPGYTSNRVFGYPVRCFQNSP